MKTLLEKIIAYMREKPRVGISSPEMAKEFKEILYVEEYMGKTIPQLASEINANIQRAKKDGKIPEIKLIDGDQRPKLHYWDNSNSGEHAPVTSSYNTNPPKQQPKKRLKESELYDPLIKYLYDGLKVKAFRIRDGKSLNKGGKGANLHRHPDIVGVEGMIGNEKWNSHVRQLAAEISYIENARIWSLEVKNKILNIGDLRRYYQQTISNSSWANMRYLCVGEITKNPRIEEEIKQLTNAHGIGIFVFNKKKPTESYIHTKAKLNDKLDLNICSVLATENSDFADFIEYATTIFKTGKIFH